MTERVEATGGTPPGGRAPEDAAARGAAAHEPAAASGAPASGGPGRPWLGPAGEPVAGRAVAGRRRGQHLLALLAYGCLSLAMFGPWILGRMTTWFLSASTQDGSIFVWMFRWWPHAITHGINPLHTTAAWAPTGINLAWVTSVPLPAVALSPVTAVSGPFFSFNLVELAAPALAAWTAYLLCRHLAGAFLPALAGGFFFGFSPYLIDEFGMGHPNLSLVFLVPLAAYLVVRLLDGSLPARLVIPLLGVVLGAQLYISTETFATLTLMGGLFALIGLAAGPAVAAAAPGGDRPGRRRLRGGGRAGHPPVLRAGRLAAPVQADPVRDHRPRRPERERLPALPDPRAASPCCGTGRAGAATATPGTWASR